MVVEGIIKSNKGFYVGDPCYVLSDEIYHHFWGDVCNWEDGVHSIPNTEYKFAVNGTAYGDGEYFDDYGRAYGVDSGTLSVIPLELIEDIENAKDSGYVTEKPGIVDICFYNGRFTVDFGYEKFTIDTNDCDGEEDFDDWDEDEEHWGYEDEEDEENEEE